MTVVDAPPPPRPLLASWAGAVSLSRRSVWDSRTRHRLDPVLLALRDRSRQARAARLRGPAGRRKMGGQARVPRALISARIIFYIANCLQLHSVRTSPPESRPAHHRPLAAVTTTLRKGRGKPPHPHRRAFGFPLPSRATSHNAPRRPAVTAASAACSPAAVVSNCGSTRCPASGASSPREPRCVAVQRRSRWGGGGCSGPERTGSQGSSFRTPATAIPGPALKFRNPNHGLGWVR